MPASCQEQTQLVLSACPQAVTGASMLADLFQMVFLSASDTWAALLAPSALEQVALVQCCEGLNHGRGTESSQTALCCSLLTFLLAYVIVQSLSDAHTGC